MAQAPDQLREEIESTRADLAQNVDRLADKTSPTRVARRHWDDVKGRVRSVSDRVMGSSAEAGHSAQHAATSVAGTVQDAAGSVADTVRQAPDAVVRKTQGNPAAVGLIAFGVGLLAASLLPETAAERRAGAQLKERAGDLVEPLREPLTEAARELREDLGGAARESAEQVKQTAKQAVQNTGEHARDAASNAKDTVRAGG